MVRDHEIASEGSGVEVAVSVLVDAEVIRWLDRERESLNQPNLKSTVRSRLVASTLRLSHLEREDLLWAPPLRERRCLTVRLPVETVQDLREQALRLDLDEQVLMAGILSDDLFANPCAIIDRGYPPLGYLRSERGRGRIYGMYFEVAGYQYAFLKTIGGEKAAPPQVLEIAFNCLADRIVSNDPPPGLRLTREILTIARAVVQSKSRMPIGR